MSSLRSVTAQDLRGPAATYRVLLVVALLFGVVLAIANSPRADDRVLALLVAAGWLPLLLLHKWPTGCFVAVVAVECIHIVAVPLGTPVQFTSIPVTTMLAAYAIASRVPWRTAWLYGGSAATVLLIVGTFGRDGDRLATNMFALDLVLGATAGGVLVRSRQLRLAAMQRRAEVAEQTKDEEARRRVAQERLRMARELHDVVAHNLALVNAQSSVAEYLIRTDPDAAEKALRNLSEHTRLALDELRSTVGLLRQVDETAGDPQEPDSRQPAHGLNDLAALIERHAAMPGTVILEVSGRPRRLPALTDLAAYRIAQEALTNARKYAPGTNVVVRLDWRINTLQLQVTNAAAPPNRVMPGSGTGHGLVGMQERAAAARGTLEAGPTSDGGWQVVAHLPSGTPPNDVDEELA